MIDLLMNVFTDSIIDFTLTSDSKWSNMDIVGKNHTYLMKVNLSAAYIRFMILRSTGQNGKNEIQIMVNSCSNTKVKEQRSVM